MTSRRRTEPKRRNAMSRRLSNSEEFGYRTKSQEKLLAFRFRQDQNPTLSARFPQQFFEVGREEERAYNFES